MRILQIFGQNSPIEKKHNRSVLLFIIIREEWRGVVYETDGIQNGAKRALQRG